MSTARPTYDGPVRVGKAIETDSRELLGQVMGYITIAVGFAALGAYLGRDLSSATGLVLFIGAFVCIFGLNAAAAGRQQLAIGLLFGPVSEDFRAVQFTPLHSLCSIQIGKGRTTAEPGSSIDVSGHEDLDTARDDLISRGVEVSEVEVRKPPGLEREGRS